MEFKNKPREIKCQTCHPVFKVPFGANVIKGVYWNEKKLNLIFLFCIKKYSSFLFNVLNIVHLLK